MFCHKYYSLSHSSNSKVPDDLGNDTNYLEFFHWLALKFDNYWEIDKNTQNWLWEFYVNERTKGAIGDLEDEPRNESYKEECSDTFYKPYLDTQDAKDIYEIIDREYTQILIPTPRNICNPDELCRTEEFTVVRHSIGNNEEFVMLVQAKFVLLKEHRTIVLHLPRTLQQKRSRMGGDSDKVKMSMEK
ncbi:hypothetical protein Tco_0235038, partial [Tanacetum coccineum]